MLIKWLHNSGAPKMFLWVAKNLALKGHNITILTYMNTDKPLIVPSHINYIHKNLQNTGILKRINIIRNIIKEEQPDISISFLLDANIYNIFACYGLNTKSIICERNDPFKPRYFKLKLLKPFFKFADGAVFQLEKVKEYYSIIKKETAVIPNPVLASQNININSFNYRDNEIVTLSRLDLKQKRLDILIYAFKKFQKLFPQYILKIYGEGPDKEKIQELITRLDLQDKVILAGVSVNPQKNIYNAKMFILTSDFEGIPNALIEAMALGLPCISTDCSPGGAALLIQNNVNGLIVPRGNINMIYAKMKYIASNPNIADQLGTNAKLIKCRFSEEKIANMWNEYLNHIYITYNGSKQISSII